MRGNRQFLERGGPAGDRLVGAAGVDGLGTDIQRGCDGEEQGLAPADVPGLHYPERKASATDADPRQPGLDFASGSPYSRVSRQFVSAGTACPDGASWALGPRLVSHQASNASAGMVSVPDGVGMVRMNPAPSAGGDSARAAPGLRPRCWAGCNRAGSKPVADTRRHRAATPQDGSYAIDRKPDPLTERRCHIVPQLAAREAPPRSGAAGILISSTRG